MKMRKMKSNEKYKRISGSNLFYLIPRKIFVINKYKIMLYLPLIKRNKNSQKTITTVSSVIPRLLFARIFIRMVIVKKLKTATLLIQLQSF